MYVKNGPKGEKEAEVGKDGPRGDLAREKAKHTGKYVPWIASDGHGGAVYKGEAWDCCRSKWKKSKFCMNTAYCDGCTTAGGHYKKEGKCMRN